MFGWHAPALLGHPELLVPLGRQDITSAVANVDFTWTQDFDDVILKYSNVVPVNNDVELRMRTTSDGGSNWDSGASDYDVIVNVFLSGRASDVGLAQAFLICGEQTAGNGISNAADEGASGTVFMPRPFDTSRYTRIHGWGGYNGVTSTGEYMTMCHGRRLSNGIVNGVQWHMQAGIMAEGVFEAWGVLPVERAA